jgi:hypothetical protein
VGVDKERVAKPHTALISTYRSGRRSDGISEKLLRLKAANRGGGSRWRKALTNMRTTLAMPEY